MSDHLGGRSLNETNAETQTERETTLRIDQIKAQRSGFDLERTNPEAETPAGLATTKQSERNEDDMGIAVLVIGESGSGKSASLRNFDKNEIGVFNVASKPLPFRGKLKKLDGTGYETITRELQKPMFKSYVIDDSQYLMAFEFFDRAKETGYNKFTDMGLHFRDLIHLVNTQTPNNVIVYFLHHTQMGEDGRLRAKTIGKMLDEKLTVEGLFSIVLLCEASKDRHYFVTQSDGRSTAKSPMGMFDSLEIDNDLKMVDDIIRDYYGLKMEEASNEQTEQF